MLEAIAILENIQILPSLSDEYSRILTPEALSFVARLHRTFNPRRKELLQKRAERQAALDSGVMPTFLPETETIRQSEWKVAPTPPDLEDRRVEITGPVERKMMINALNSGAKVFMADLEDALSPTWDNIMQGQINLKEAVRRTLRLESDAKTYTLNKELAVLMVRPRGLHLVEKNVLVDGEPISASLFDFGLYFLHNARALIERNTGPYFYLPKLESHLEARWWNEVFNAAQDALDIPSGTIRATVLIETIMAAFEMEEILYELRQHAAGLNAGRWDYIFSVIKKFSGRADLVLPDRAQVTMTVPFMRAYTELLIRTCHKRGAHAIGGMAAFIPNRREPEITEVALAKVREDKERESRDGCDGTWVAHPDLIPVAKAVFVKMLGEKSNQKGRLREDVHVKAEHLLDIRVPGGKITEAGVRNNISVALQYLAAWLEGSGAVAIYNLMEDTATAEIARAQLWQWVHHNAKMDDGRPVTQKLFETLCQEEMASLPQTDSSAQAAEILERLVVSDTFVEFLTSIAYDYLN